MNVIIFVLFFLSYYLFFLSLEKCTEGEDKCCKKFSWMKLKVIEELLSCILTTILLGLIILRKISILHVLHFIIVFISFYLYSNGIEFDDHGYYNIKYFFVIVISMIIVILLLNYLLSIKKKNNPSMY